MTRKRLNSKQIRFVEEYLKDLNATAAAKRAGYKHSDIGRRLVTKSHVLAAIKRAQKSTLKSLKITRENVLLELARISFSDPRKMFNADGTMKHPKDWDDNIAAAISGFDVVELFEGSGQDKVKYGLLKKVRLWNKCDAADKLAQHLGILIPAPPKESKEPPRLVVEIVKDEQGAGKC